MRSDATDAVSRSRSLLSIGTGLGQMGSLAFALRARLPRMQSQPIVRKWLPSTRSEESAVVASSQMCVPSSSIMLPEEGDRTTNWGSGTSTKMSWPIPASTNCSARTATSSSGSKSKSMWGSGCINGRFQRSGESLAERCHGHLSDGQPSRSEPSSGSRTTPKRRRCGTARSVLLDEVSPCLTEVRLG